MAARFLQLNLATRAPRYGFTAAVRDAISGAGGWITDFHQYSSVSVCVNFELESRHTGDLRKRLQTLDAALSPQSLESLEQAGRPPGTAAVMGTVQITFVHDEPDALMPPPAVPG